MRRERPHPGATLRLWDYNGWRHQVVLTNDDDADIAALEALHRGHAQVENRIKNLKDTGLARLPFRDWHANRLWVELVLLAAVLLVAVQQLVDDDELRVAEPRRLRYALLNVAARIAVHAAEPGCTSTPPGPGHPSCSLPTDDCPSSPPRSRNRPGSGTRTPTVSQLRPAASRPFRPRTPDPKRPATSTTRRRATTPDPSPKR